MPSVHCICGLVLEVWHESVAVPCGGIRVEKYDVEVGLCKDYDFLASICGADVLACKV